MKYDLKIEAVLDDVRERADLKGHEITVEPAFGGDRGDMACIIHNTTTGKFGMVSINVVEYPDDPIVFFSFNAKLFAYAKMEGFTSTQMLDGFDNKVFIKETSKGFMKYVIE